jgi:hypothetical protein
MAGTYAGSRATLHRIAAHVLGRRRFEVSGRFGLRASPGGIATPAFGEAPETVRIAGLVLIREVGGTADSIGVAGATLGELAAFAGADLSVPFSCGKDTPDPGVPDEPLDIAAADTAVIADWYAIAWRALDTVLAAMPASAEPATVQLWPEHFDTGTNVALAAGQRVNLGFSPGDGFEPEPYAYVGPWGPERPGDPAYWNAPFGAVLRRADARASGDALAAALTFLRTGLRYAGRQGPGGS